LDTVFVPITPTEPIPADISTPMSYAQGERMIQLLTDLHQTVGEKIDSSILLLTDIKNNTIPTVYDPSNPTGITFAQADDIISGLHQINEIIAYGVAFFVLYFVVRFLYKFISGTLLGGL
jgi:hypothetical protein